MNWLLFQLKQIASLYAVAPVGRYKLAVLFERALTKLIPALWVRVDRNACKRTAG